MKLCSSGRHSITGLWEIIMLTVAQLVQKRVDIAAEQVSRAITSIVLRTPVHMDDLRALYDTEE